MVSRRNFFTITLIMLVLLFMFLAPEVVKNEMNNYSVNAYADGTGSAFTAEEMYPVGEIEAERSGRHIVYIGNPVDGAAGTMVRQWCVYSKRYLENFTSVRQYRPRKGRLPEAVLIDSAYLDAEMDTGTLTAWVEQWGLNLVFCNLPDLTQLKTNMKLRRLMGLRAVLFERIKVEGIHLFDGFLLGGERIYQLDDTMEEGQQDLELTMPWCQTASGTKVYMVGMMGDDTINEELPAIIWRNSIGKSKIFVVNGDYLADNAGIGFLEAMIYEMSPYSLYPIVNAQNLAVLNYPSLASENEDDLMRLYSQSMEAVYRDIVWPGLAAAAEKSGKRLTCMMAPQQDYEDSAQPQEKTLVYYMKLLQEGKGEAGISAAAKSVMGIDEKFDRDAAFFQETLPDYQFLSFYQDSMTTEEAGQALEHGFLKNVRTLFSGYDAEQPLISYQNAGVTRQLATNDGFSHTFAEDIRMNSIETALGYSSIAVDLNRIAYPQADSDGWEKLYDQFARNTNTYWRAYEGLSATTLSESDERIRRFFALNYEQRRTDNVIALSIENFEKKAYFLLRLPGEHVEDAEGADYKMLSEGVFLIEASQAQVSIMLGGGRRQPAIR